MKECSLLEQRNVKVLSAGADLNAAATVGGRVSMKNTERLSILLIVGTSTGAAVTLSLVQSNAATGGTSKPLNIISPYYFKVDPATVFTRVEAPGVDTVDLSTQFAAASGVIGFEVLAEDLDVNNGFSYVQLNIAKTTAAKQGIVLALAEQRQWPSYQNAI